jgi:hypothetical protein
MRTDGDERVNATTVGDASAERKASSSSVLRASDPLPDSGPGRYRFVDHREYLDALLTTIGVDSDVVLPEDAPRQITDALDDWIALLPR